MCFSSWGRKVRTLLSGWTKLNLPLCMYVCILCIYILYHISFFRSSVAGHLGFSCVSVVVNSVLCRTSLWDACVFSNYVSNSCWQAQLISRGMIHCSSISCGSHARHWAYKANETIPPLEELAAWECCWSWPIIRKNKSSSFQRLENNMKNWQPSFLSSVTKMHQVVSST